MGGGSNYGKKIAPRGCIWTAASSHWKARATHAHKRRGLCKNKDLGWFLREGRLWGCEKRKREPKGGGKGGFWTTKEEKQRRADHASRLILRERSRIERGGNIKRGQWRAKKKEREGEVEEQDSSKRREAEESFPGMIRRSLIFRYSLFLLIIRCYLLLDVSVDYWVFSFAAWCLRNHVQILFKLTLVRSVVFNPLKEHEMWLICCTLPVSSLFFLDFIAIFLRLCFCPFPSLIP